MSNSGTNSMAVVSLISGIASWMIAPFVASIAAVICGHMARKQIRSTGEEGDAMALIGLVLGYLNLVASCLAGLFAVLMMVFGVGMTAAFGAAG